MMTLIMALLSANKIMSKAEVKIFLSFLFGTIYREMIKKIMMNCNTENYGIVVLMMNCNTENYGIVTMTIVKCISNCGKL